MKTRKLNFLNRIPLSCLALVVFFSLISQNLHAQVINPWTVNPPTSIYHLPYKVGIGTPTPSTKLMVLAPEKEHIFRLANEQETVMFVKNNGKVGIGTTTQDCRVNIKSDSLENPLRVTVDGSTSLFAHQNKGVTIGSAANPPEGGLKVAKGGDVLFGKNELGVGVKMMWLTDKAAFRGGEVIEIAGTGSDVWNPVNVGQHSFAFGLGPIAKGDKSVSMGSFANAEGDVSVALGSGRAFGVYSVAIGNYPVAEGEGAVALGRAVNATGNYSFATGYTTEAIGNRSTAMGSNTKAVATYSTAIGKNNIGLDNGLFEIGMGISSSQRENAFSIMSDGTVGIGTTYIPNNYLVAIDGDVICEGVRVELSQNWPDYVFKSDYELPSLNEVKEHIDAKGHLPGIPAAREVEKDGIDLGDMQVKMMEKIEELTLYILQQEERIRTLETQLEK